MLLLVLASVCARTCEHCHSHTRTLLLALASVHTTRECDIALNLYRMMGVFGLLIRDLLLYVHYDLSNTHTHTHIVCSGKGAFTSNLCIHV